MNQTRVIVVDDDDASGDAVAAALDAEPSIESVTRIRAGEASQLDPDDLTGAVVVVNVDLPARRGLAAIRILREANARLISVPYGGDSLLDAKASRERGLKAVVRQIRAAARQSSRPSTKPSVRVTVLPRDKAGPKPDASPGRKPSSRGASKGTSVIAIGSSTGGPETLASLLAKLPVDLGVPVVITQHMMAGFTGKLVESLAKRARIKIVEGATGMPLEARCVYLAPGNLHMVVRPHGALRRLVTYHGREENSCRPAVDPMFRSVARVYGAGVLAVVLTGMGQDGLIGARQIKAAGGRVIVQDRESSTVWGMPGAVSNAGLADEELSISDIANRIRSAAMSRSRAASPRSAGGTR